MAIAERQIAGFERADFGKEVAAWHDATLSPLMAEKKIVSHCRSMKGSG
jgi:hypothetical protein